MRIQKSLGDKEAELAIQLVKKELIKRNKSAVIAVADSHGELIALLRLDGAPLQSITVGMNKAFTAAREGKPTIEIGQKMKDPAKGYDIAYYGDSRYLGFAGGMPVMVGDDCLGAVAVSGLTGVEDMELAQMGVDAILKTLTA